MILRDDTGSFVAVKSNYFNRLGLVREVEITGLVKAIHWVLSMGFFQVPFELDAKGVVDAIASTDQDLLEFDSSCIIVAFYFVRIVVSKFVMLGDKLML